MTDDLEIRGDVSTELDEGAFAADGDREDILWTENLSKSFNGFTAVRDLNITVERGSITGMVGPNGAGKSTTFLMLATLLQPSSGFSIVCGHDPVLEPREVRRRIGYMPDFFGIYDDLRVDEYLEFFAASYSVPVETRAKLSADLLELVDLTGKKDALVNSLSRGMKQRLCLARALVHDPELLILDEPASGLDPRARVELRALMLELQKMGKTILISSHILSELEEVCSQVVILEAGQLVAQGSPSEISSTFAGDARAFRVRVVAGAEDRLREAVAALPGFDAALWRDDGSLDVRVDDEAEAARLLGSLVKAGVPVVGFTEEREGLEEIFMRVTKGIVR